MRRLQGFIASLLGLILYAPAVFAQQQLPTQAPSLESYQAQAGDQALGMLAAIFGSANGIFGGPEDESVNAMMLAFNVAVMAVGAAWFSYNIITATVQGSFDGEFLGRRYSTVWMPIRTVSGAALLVPVWKGWNLAGLAMAFSASVGIGIGNSVWGGLNGEIIPALVSAPSMKPVSELARPILTSRMCLANRWVDQARLKKANVAATAAEYSVNWASKPISSANSTGITYGAQPAANGQTESTCGVVEVVYPRTEATDPDVQAVISVARNAMASALQGLDSDIAQLVEPAKNLDPDDPDAVRNLEKTISAALPRLVATRQMEMDRTIAAVVNGKNANVSQRIKEISQKYGWLAAGATPTLITINNIDATRGAPNVRTTAPQANPEPATIIVPDAEASFDAAMVGGAVDGGGTAPQASTTPSESACGISSIGKDFIKKCIENPLIAKVKSAGIGSLVGATSSNPLIYSQQLGMKILSMIETTIDGFFIALAVVAAVAVLTGPAFPAAGSILGAGINLFGFLLGLVLIPLGLFAIQLVAYVPLMLTIAWIMAVGAWLLVVGESLIAATLWALVHLDPEGEGMGQRTAHGYIFALNLLFRPSILVFAAFFAQRFCGVLGGFANGVMSGAIAKMMEANSSSLFIFLIMMAAGIWITTSLNIKIVGTAASLMNLIPNQIFTWIGGHFGSDVGSGVSESVGHDVKGGMASAGNTAGNAANMAGRTAGNKVDESGPGSTERGINQAVKRMEVDQAARQRFVEKDTGGGAVGPGATGKDSDVD